MEPCVDTSSLPFCSNRSGPQSASMRLFVAVLCALVVASQAANLVEKANELGLTTLVKALEMAKLSDTIAKDGKHIILIFIITLSILNFYEALTFNCLCVSTCTYLQIGCK